ncbi:hypothetical protein BGZ57DRAFT_912937 [Hyaloscypha finlandica]|nr:hypothetical protein BGZ57DRAFT_912937 [Hyaloscypha finlandica]
MSVRASPSPRVGENKAQQVSPLGSRLKLDEAEGPWGHRRMISEPSIPSNSGSRFPDDEKMTVPGVTLAGAAMSAAPPLNLPSRSRPNGEQMPPTPRASPLTDQPAIQRPISTDQESRNSPVKPSRLSYKIANSTASSSESQRPPSPSDVAAEARKIRPGSAAEVEWDRIQELRSSNWNLRSQIREMRNNLRELQLEKSRADDILFRRLTVQALGFGQGPLPHGQKTLNELMHDCQVARDDYGPLEDDCNRLEDLLNGQELELDRLEEAFYNRLPDEPSILSESPLHLAENDDSQPYSGSVEEEEEELKYHPLVARYLSRMGDLDLLQERFDDLLDEKRILEEEGDKRLHFGLTLNVEDQQWLENAHIQVDELSEKIRFLEKDVEIMKQDCVSRGLVDADGEPVDFQIREQRSFDGEEDLNPLEHRSEYVKYPLLIPHPGMKPRNFEAGPEPDEKSDFTTIRINEWLLQQLRTSALDVNLLASTFQNLSGAIDDQWQIAVLKRWYRDDTMGQSNRTRVYTSSMTTQAPLISNSSERLKKPDRVLPGKALPFYGQRSLTSFSSLDDDEMEILDYPRRR